MFRPTAFLLTLPSIITVTVALTLLNGPSLIQPLDSINASSSNTLSYTCLEDAYGRDLNSASCMEALGQIDAFSTVQQTYGQRYTGPYDVNLPKLYTSSDGLCSIQPRIISSRGSVGGSARASLAQVATAARLVIDKCVNASPSQGGGASGIGGDNNLFIIVQKMDQQEAQCSGTVSPSLLPSCQNLLDLMPANRDVATWGPQEETLAYYKLPKTFYSRDRHCALTVRSNGGHSDVTSRYLIWFAATELHNVCLRRGKTGRRDNLGVHKQLFIELGPA